MSLEAQAIMQGLHNRVNTQSHGWAQFGVQSYLGYKRAYDFQTAALEVVKKSTELSKLTGRNATKRIRLEHGRTLN